MTGKIQPKCLGGYPQYISAEGQWFPCCFASQRHEDWENDWFNRHRKEFDLTRKSLGEILGSPKLDELRRLWQEHDGRHAPYWCKVECSRG